jgi:hypothetical protein
VPQGRDLRGGDTPDPEGEGCAGYAEALGSGVVKLGILEALQVKTASGDNETLASEYRGLGRFRFETFVNLCEVVTCLHILKLRIIEFVRDRGFAQNAIQVYAQEEFEHQVGLFLSSKAMARTGFE